MTSENLPLNKTDKNHTEFSETDLSIYPAQAEPPVDKSFSTQYKKDKIQTKMQAGKGKGFERWATVRNLKEAAKTLLFLTDNGISDYDELAARNAPLLPARSAGMSDRRKR